MEKYDYLFVSHYWKVISNHSDVCHDLDKHTDMEDIDISEAKSLVEFEDYHWQEKFL